MDKIECKDCKKVFYSRKYYLNHCVTAHLKYEDIDTFPIKVYPCPICHKLFACNQKLEWHVRTHTGDKPEICHICGKRFSYKGNLESHIKIHTGDKPFVCDICGKRFIHRKELRKHIETHNVGNSSNKKCVLEEPSSESENTDGECEERGFSYLEESKSQSQEMEDEYEDTEAAVMSILSSTANGNVVYEGEHQDIDAARSEIRAVN